VFGWAVTFGKATVSCGFPKSSFVKSSCEIAKSPFGLGGCGFSNTAHIDKWTLLISLFSLLLQDDRAHGRGQRGALLGTMAALGWGLAG